MARNSNSLSSVVVAEFGKVFLPLSRLDSQERLTALLADLGWEFPNAGDLGGDFGALADGVLALRDKVYGAEDPEPDGLRVAVILELLAATEALVRTVAELPQQFETALGSDVLNDSGILDSFVPRLFDYLVVTFLQRSHPALHDALVVIGLIELSNLEADPASYRREFTLRTLRWDRIPLLLSDPAALAEAALKWGQVDFDSDLIIDRLKSLIRSIGLPGDLYVQDPAVASALGRTLENPQELRIPLQQGGTWPDQYFEVGLSVSPLTAADRGGLGVGLLPYFLGPWDTSPGLLGGWRFEISGPRAAGVGVGLVVRPVCELELHADILDAAADAQDFHFEAALIRESADDNRIRLFGEPDSSRLDLESLTLSVTLDRSGSEEDVQIAIVADQLELAIVTGGADAFLRTMLPFEDIVNVFDLTLQWSSRSGFSFQGSPTFDVTLPVYKSLGPITLETLHLVIGLTDDDEIEIELAVTGGADIAIMAARIERVGISCRIAFPGSGGNLGPASLIGPAFKPPSSISFTIATGAVNGGGIIEYDEDAGRYFGALSLDILAVGIDAIVIVDTRLPGDPDGWAFFASLTATFPGIPLGFGFTLLGVGGLLALNRSLDVEALSAGLRTGAVDSLLFPDDPVGDIVELIAQIDNYFPLTAGNTVVGPIIQIGWGSPTLITGQLGVVISLPEGVIALLGSITALLPTPDAPLLTINMDALGVIDVGEGTLSLTASLYDSRLLATIDLGGDMATYLRATSQPYFLLSVGGFHPGFEPPSVIPASMYDLRVMQASIEIASNVEVMIQAYFALTSNSVQFGALVHVEASVEVWPTTYTARGWLGFDVLLEFSPFRIEASMSAGVGIYAGDRELMGVQLTFVLEGPEPWSAAGTASFKFFGVKVTFAFDVGSGAGSEPRPITHPRQDALAAMRSPAAWGEAAPIEGLAAGLIYTGSPADQDDVVWVRPDHQLIVRQSIAPLERPLEIVGQALPAAGEELLSVTEAGFGDVPAEDWEHAVDWFAPAQFEQLTPSQRLARASFEEMPAGVTFGNPVTAITSQPEKLGTRVETAYEKGTLKNSIGTGAAGRGMRRYAPPVEPMFAIRPTSYTLARSADGSEAKEVLLKANVALGGVNQYAALATRRKQIAANPAEVSRLVAVPATAILEPAA